jgi:CBS domain-containing protein
MTLGEQFRSEVVTVAPEDTIHTAMWKMKDANVGAVVVVADCKVVGILTDRDVAIQLALEDTAVSTLVKHVMTAPVLTIWEDQGVFNATQYLMGHRIRRLPIITRDTEELVGMVTLDDLFSLLAQELRNLSEAVAPALAFKPNDV